MRKWIFFDLGSTLINEEKAYEAFVNRCQQALDEAGCFISREELFQTMIEAAHGGQDPITTMWQYYAPEHCVRPRWNHDAEELYDGVKELLEILSAQYRLGIIANQGKNLENRLENLKILSYFSIVIASAEVGVAKPDKTIFELALERAGISPSEAIYVGDRVDNDMIPAKQLGMQTVRILQGFGQYTPEDQFYPSDFSVLQLSDIAEILKN